MSADDLKLISNGAKTIAEEILHAVSQEDDYDILPGELPPSLAKALDDPFDYMIGLRDGRVIHFVEAKLRSQKWVTLIGHEGLNYTGGDGGSIEMTGVEFGFPRGIDVRISDIMWCADAPGGS